MKSSLQTQPNFDPIARPYRWLEYLTLGRALERCRFHFIPRLAHRSHALVLGDGDGRFLARLLTANPLLTADAIDTSAAMLTLLRNRCKFAQNRLTTHHTDALSFCRNDTRRSRYDLVVTHFFLDCLTQSQVDTLATSIAPLLTPNALWLVSDFRIPSGPMRLPAWLFVRSLYLAFSVLTNLRPTRLPDHRAALARAEFNRVASFASLAGLLVTELWDRPSVQPFR